MAKRIEDFELDPVVVLIPDAYEITMDQWLADLAKSEPLDLGISGAELVAEARAERE